jgi:hypothetical protein
MTMQVHQHPDGWVIVRTDSSGTYKDTKANFELDFGVTLPALPAPANERIYTQGIRHPIQMGNNIIAGGPMPWTLGDQILGNIAAGLAAQAARPTPPPPYP